MADFFLKSWDFIKTYKNYLILGILIVLFSISCYFFMKKEKLDVVTEMKKQQQIHDEEIKEIEKIRKEEKKEYEENFIRLQLSLESIQQKHDEDMRALEERKTKQVDGMVNTWKKDPTGVEMAHQIGKITGFQVLVQEKQK